MRNRNFAKIGWLIPVLVVGLFPLIAMQFGKVFFVNRTASIPTGIYIVVNNEYINIGDTVVFESSSFSGKLIKYVAAGDGTEFCTDESGGLWIAGIAVAEKNTQKYPNSLLDQSICHKLKPDELLVLGDHENSYDSRYFGPIKKQDIIASVKLLWEFD